MTELQASHVHYTAIALPGSDVTLRRMLQYQSDGHDCDILGSFPAFTEFDTTVLGIDILFPVGISV